MLSYSRRDKDFCEELHDKLTESGFSTWVDWKDIPPASEWLDEIYKGINNADSFLIVISPDSIASPECEKEVVHAMEGGKRIIPVVWRFVEPEEMHERLAAANWVYMREGEDDFDEGFKILVEALQTDLEHVRQHTRLHLRATEWDDHGRDRSSLLRGKDLRSIGHWIENSIEAEMEPAPTALQQTYLQASRVAKSRFQQTVVGLASVATLIVGMAIFALFQRQEAVSQKLVAEESASIAQQQRQAAIASKEEADTQRQAAVEAKEEADTQRELAVQSANIAEERRQEAEIAKEEADTQRQAAVEAKEEADTQRELAVQSANIAEERQQEAEIARKEADTQRQLALQAAELAERQRRLAESEKKRAEEQANIALSRRLAEQAIQNIETDLELSIWLALSSVDKANTDVASDQTIGVEEAKREAKHALHQVVNARRIRRTINAHDGTINNIVYSPLKGESDLHRLVTVGADQSAKVWDVISNTMTLLAGHTGIIHRADFNFDGRVVATGGADGKVLLWNTESGQIQLEIEAHEYSIDNLAYHPNKQQVATTSASENCVKLWDTGSGIESAKIVVGHIINDLDYNKDGSKIVTADQSGTIKIWTTNPGKELLSIESTGRIFNNVIFSPDSSLIVASGENYKISIWDAQNGQLKRNINAHTELITDLSFDPSGNKIASASYDKTTKIWDVQSGRKLLTLLGHQNKIHSIDYNGNGSRLATASEDGIIKVWDVTPNNDNVPIRNHKSSVTSINFSQDKMYFVTTSTDGTAKLWQLESKQIRHVFSHGKNSEIQLLTSAFSNDSLYVATGGKDSKVFIWEVKTGRILRELMTEEKEIYSLSFSSDGRHLAVGGKSVSLWNLESGELADILLGHEDEIHCLNYSPDGKKIATAGQDTEINIWNTKTGNLTFSLSGHSMEIRKVIFSNDSLRLGTASLDGTIKIWNLEKRQVIRSISIWPEIPQSIAFSPDGSQIASCSKNKIAKVWDIYSGQVVLTLTGHSAEITDIKYSFDGQTIATVSVDKTIQFHPLMNIAELKELAEIRSTRQLTNLEKQEFLLND